MVMMKAFFLLMAVVLMFSAVIHAAHAVVELMQKARDFKASAPTLAVATDAPSDDRAAQKEAAEMAMDAGASPQQAAEAITGDIVDGLDVIPER